MIFDQKVAISKKVVLTRNWVNQAAGFRNTCWLYFLRRLESSNVALERFREIRQLTKGREMSQINIFGTWLTVFQQIVFAITFVHYKNFR